MRKVNHDFTAVKEFVQSLVGSDVKMLVNKGRKKYVRYNGTLECVYPSVFMVRVKDHHSVEILTYSYSDVLCGDVKIAALPAGS